MYVYNERSLPVMINIFDYTDFRKFLEDYYNEQKARKPQFSYRYFANKAGFKNKGFVFNIIKGEKKLSKTSIYKLSRALELRKKEEEYFENLVAFNQAKDHDEKDYFYRKMEETKSRSNSKSTAQLVRRDQYEFYSYWYYSAIRSLINMYGFKDDYKWLARNVYPVITVKQAKKAVTMLEKLNLIEKQENGVYRVVNKTITTGKEFTSLAVTNLHLETMRLAADALREMPKQRRNITGLVLGISHKTYEKICEETHKFQEKLMQMAEKDEEADTVYQFNFHLFPMSQTEKKAGRK
jgi:uncharacterized protein (TIGR02147 family)